MNIPTRSDKKEGFGASDNKAKHSSMKTEDDAAHVGEVYDPYTIVDPFDKEALRRQKRLRRAALRGEIPICQDDEIGSTRNFATTRQAIDTGEKPSGEKSLRRQGTKRRALALVVSVFIIALVGAGGFALYDYLRPPDFSSYADTGISISGIEEADFIVTPQELSELECVEVSATGQGRGPQGESSVGTVTAYGPTLNTFLAQYGLSQTDFSRIVFECKDGYTVVLARDALESEVILTLSVDKDELAASHQPLRLVIPDESSGQWAYGILRIEFEQ